jgi:deoxyribonuclease-4
MRFGFHISIAGGFSKVVKRATARGCQTIQVFSRNPRGWKYTPLNLGEVAKFKVDIVASGVGPVFVHMPYLPNLAAPEPELYQRSIDSLCEDLKRAETLGAPFLVTHVGNRGEMGEEEALNRVSQAINLALRQVKNAVILLLENTAGQGTEIGYQFDQIGRIISEVEDKGRVGVCLDTAHAFEAGYQLSTPEGLVATLEEFDQTIGLNRLHLLHLNDSKTPLGSRSDRHWHIGEGHIGLRGFELIVNHPHLHHLPGIMETPRREDADDLKNMEAIRRLDRTQG